MKNLVFHFEGGRHASFPQKPVVKLYIKEKINYVNRGCNLEIFTILLSIICTLFLSVKLQEVKLHIRPNGYFEFCGGTNVYVEIIKLNGTTEEKLCETNKEESFNPDRDIFWKKENKNLGNCEDIGPIFL